MTREDFIEKINQLCRRHLRNEGVSQTVIDNISMELPGDIANLTEEIGMLPPTNTCKLVPDTLRGGMKHSETKREWDKE